ncbi:MAG: PDZ domain-containing protein, partial [Litorilinea sp.]
MNAGYYRFPTIHGENIIFVSEDDLWSVSTRSETGSQAGEETIARRLTSNHGEVTYPVLSPTGEYVAFVGREEGGPEIYVMDAAGGRERRLTYLNSSCQVVGWMPDAQRVIFCSTYGQVNTSEMGLFTVDVTKENGIVEPLPYGPARTIAYGPNGEVVLGRNTGDPARWKRYRGGTAGHLWIDSNGDGEFERFLADVPGNIASPMWLTVQGKPRIFFVSDHEGIGNLYSCRPAGDDIRRHTDHESYYVRNPSSDGRRIVYHLGADLYIYEPATDLEVRVAISYRSPRVQRNRKFVDAGRYMDGYALHPSGLAVAITSRGKTFGFFNHEGAVLQYGKRESVRYRQPEWLGDGRRFVVVTDETGEESLEIFGPEPYGESVRLDGLDLGRIVDMKASPVAAKLAVTNHRYELVLVDLDTAQANLVDRSRFRNITGFDWSPDGRWLAYSFAATSQTSEIRLYQLPEPAPDAENDGKSPDADAPPDTDAPASAADADTGNVDTGDTDTVDAEAVDAEAAGPVPLAGEPDATRVFTVSEPILHDVSPAFDPAGKYLYFLSYREFNPVYDALHFDLSFPWGMRPYLITLQAGLPNPFIPQPDFGDMEGEPDDDESDDEHDDAPDGEGDADGAGETDDGYEDEDEDRDGEYDADAYAEGLNRRGRGADRRGYRRGRRDNGRPAGWSGPGYGRHRFDQDAPATAGSTAEGDDAPAAGDGKPDADASGGRKDARKGPKPVRIDLEGITRRIVAFPVPDARYGQIAGIHGKAIFTVFPVTGQLDIEHEWDDEEDDDGQLRAYDFKDYRNELLADRVSSFDISANGKKLIYNTGNQLRVINAGDKAPGGGPPRKSGWIPLHRVKVSVNPQSEWEQMFREAWRLQRDHFWTEDMSQVDWQAVFTRYFDLIPRVSTRSELSDLLWEMQGELGTSHAYEFGGDYRPRPHYGQGFLGAEFTWDAGAKGYRVARLLEGDPWLADAHSALLIPGVDIRQGDLLININGQMLDEEIGPGQMLVNQARNEVMLVFKRTATESETESANEAAGEAATEPEVATDEAVTEDAAAEVALPATHATTG